jgi:hypothetical protein
VHQEGGAVSARIRLLDFLSVKDYHHPFALWTLIQVPTGDEGKGRLIVPVVKDAQPIHYFDPIPGSYLKVFENHVEFTIDGQRELKLGIRPEDLPKPQEARMEYRFKKNGKNVLISVFSSTGAKSQDECVDPEVKPLRCASSNPVIQLRLQIIGTKIRRIRNPGC